MEFLLFFLIIILFVLIITLFNRTRDQEDSLQSLRMEINWLQAIIDKQTRDKTMKDAEEPVPPPVVPPHTPPTPVVQPMQKPIVPQVSEPQPAPPLAPPPPEIDSISAFRAKWEAEVTPPPQAVADTACDPARMEPSRSREEWEMLIGGNVFNKIGALALVIAAAFAMKYAFDQGLIGPALRVLIGLLIGATLIWGGDLSRRKNLAIFAQGLVAAGIGILYLSVYAAYGIFHLPQAPLPLALFGMFLVTLVAFWQSLRSDSVAVALLGWAGGFLTPLLLRPAVGDPMASTGMGLFIYLVFLEIGLLAVQLRKDAWAFLELLTIGGIATLFGLWFIGHAPLQQNLLPVPFLTVFWGLLVLTDLYRALRRSTTFSDFRLLLFFLNGVLYALGLYLVLDVQRHSWLAPIFLGIGAVYCLLGLGIARRQTITGTPVLRYLLSAAILLAVATALRFHGFLLMTLWALEGVALAYCGLRWKLNYLWNSALLLLGVAFFRLLLTGGALATLSPEAFSPVWNLRCLAFVTLAAACGICAILARRLRYEGEDVLVTMLHYAWTTQLFILLTAEIRDTFHHLQGGGPSAIFDHAQSMVLAVSWTFYSLPLVWLGLRKRLNALVYIGMAVMLLGVGTIALMGMRYEPITRFVPLLNMRAIPFVLAVIGLTLEARWLSRQRETHPWIAGVVHATEAISALLLFEMVTVETLDFFRHHLSTIDLFNDELALYRPMVLAIVWALFSLPVVWFGVSKRSPAFFYTGIGALALGCFWVAFNGFQYDMGYAYIPLLNIRGIAFLLTIFATGLQLLFLGARREQYAGMPAITTVLQVVLALLIFELCSIETISFFDGHMWPNNIRNDIYEFSKYMALAAIWAIYSVPVTWIGLRKRLAGVAWTGLGALFLAIATMAFHGISITPLDFTLVLNHRALPFLMIIILTGLHCRFLAKQRDAYPWTGGLRGILQVVAALLILELGTVEVWDYFDNTQGYDYSAQGLQWYGLRITAISVVWLVYSVCLLGYGIWQRLGALRLLAISIFLFTIFAICLYYIFIPNTLYRIIAFAVLGATLLATSYLYQRFRATILAAAEEEPKTPTPS